MKKNRLFVSIVSAVSAACILTACGSNPSVPESTTAAVTSGAAEIEESAEVKEHEPVTLVVWKNTADSARMDMLNENIEHFMDLYPWITVESTSIPDDYNTKLELAFANGDAPDVFWSGGDDAAYIANGYLAPLDGMFAAWDYKDNILEAHVQALQELDRENGYLYMIPDGTNINCIWYRTDWFAEAGIDTPETWEDIFSAIEKLTDKDEERYGYAIRGGKGSAANLEMMMFSYAGVTDYFNEDGSCNVNNELIIEFVERWLGNYGIYSAESDLSNGGSELPATFQSGRSALIQHNTGSAAGHVEAFGGDTSKFSAIAFPKSVTGASVQPGDTPSGIMIAEQCENKDEAFLLAAYLATGDVASRWSELVGALPSDKIVLETADWIKDTSWMKMGADMLLSKETQYYMKPKFLPNYNAILTNEVEPMIQSVMIGQMSAQEMCDTWADLMEKEYKDYLK